MLVSAVNPTISPAIKNQEVRKNVSFKGDLSLYLVIRAFTKGVQAIKNMEKASYIRELSSNLVNIVENYGYKPADASKNRMLYAVIARTPDSFYTFKDESSLSGTFYNLDKPMYTVETMSEVRKQALQVLPCVEDTDRYVVQSKMDFLNSILDNGYEIPLLFYDVFRELNDDYYARFKISVIEECLYSTKYAQLRKPKAPMDETFAKSLTSSQLLSDPYYCKSDINKMVDIMAYADSSKQIEEFWGEKRIIERLLNNLALISTLNPQIYGRFIENNRKIIEQSKEKVQSAIFNASPKFTTQLKNFYIRNIKYL